jgi:hypothetical protein
LLEINCIAFGLMNKQTCNGKAPEGESQPAILNKYRVLWCRQLLYCGLDLQ